MEDKHRIRIAKLEVVILQNGEIVCAGKRIGWMNEKVPSLLGKGIVRLEEYIEEVEE